MAIAVRNCLGVDIGSHNIRVAHMEMGKAGPRVVNLIEEALDLDPALDDAARLQAITKKLQDMLKANKVTTREAVFCISGQNVIVRFFTLPKSTPDRLNRMIMYEARQKIPFPLDKTVMQYQIFEEKDSSNVNVLLVAVKKENVLSFMRLVERSGLRPIGISVSSLALYNFNELNNSTRDLAPVSAKDLKAKEREKEKKEKEKQKKEKELAKKLKKGVTVGASVENEPEPDPEPADEDQFESMGFEEIKAYVNIGASLTELSIPKIGNQQLLGFTRTVPLAGNEMDRVLRDKLGLESLDQARSVKESESVALATDFELQENQDGVNMKASELVTGIADRLINELRRTLDFYISQPDGVAVDSFVLSGGLADLRFFKEYIEEKMGLPVELASAKHPQIRMPDSMPRRFSSFAIAIGLALQGLQISQNTIDFLPENFKIKIDVRKSVWEIGALAAMLGLIVLLSMGVGSKYIAAFQAGSQEADAIIQKSKKDSDGITKLEGKASAISNAYTQLSKAAAPRDFWFNFLLAFHEKRPADVLIDQLWLRTDGYVVVVGRSPSQSSINNFVKELKLTPEFIVDASLANLSQPGVDPRFRTQVQEFQILVKTSVRAGRLRPLGIPPTLAAPVAPGRR